MSVSDFKPSWASTIGFGFQILLVINWIFQILLVISLLFYNLFYVQINLLYWLCTIGYRLKSLNLASIYRSLVQTPNTGLSREPGITFGNFCCVPTGAPFYQWNECLTTRLWKVTRSLGISVTTIIIFVP